MKQEEAYKIFLDEMAKNNPSLSKALEIDPFVSIGFNCGWRLGRENQKVDDINKACEWLKSHLENADDNNYLNYGCWDRWGTAPTIRVANLIKDFQKAMKGE